jgi:hypothetical protein
MGRTTGATAGTVHGCRSETRVYASERDPVRSTELTILPFTPGGPATFAYDGDSGALVYNGRGEPDSMVWGRTLEKQGHPLLDVSRMVFATPLPPILEDIRATVERANPGKRVEVAIV